MQARILALNLIELHLLEVHDALHGHELGVAVACQLLIRAVFFQEVGDGVLLTHGHILITKYWLKHLTVIGFELSIILNVLTLRNSEKAHSDNSQRNNLNNGPPNEPVQLPMAQVAPQDEGRLGCIIDLGPNLLIQVLVLYLLLSASHYHEGSIKYVVVQSITKLLDTIHALKLYENDHGLRFRSPGLQLQELVNFEEDPFVEFVDSFLVVLILNFLFLSKYLSLLELTGDVEEAVHFPIRVETYVDVHQIVLIDVLGGVSWI